MGTGRRGRPKCPVGFPSAVALQERSAHAPEEGRSPQSSAISPGLILGLVGPGAEGQGWEEPVGDMVPFLWNFKQS